MSLKDQLKEDMKAAMKAREEGKTALSVIRMVNSAIKNTEINDKVELDDNGILGILAKEMKTRQDSLAEFEKAGREDLISHVKEEWQYYKNTYQNSFLKLKFVQLYKKQLLHVAIA